MTGKGFFDRMLDEQLQEVKSQKSGIKWHKYNYPPGLNLIHFDPDHDGLSPSQLKPIRLIHNTLRFTFIELVLNFFITIIHISIEDKTAMYLVYSILQFVIISIFASIAFYKGYRGVASNSKSDKKKFIILQLVLGLVALILSIIGSSNVHGWVAVSKSEGFATIGGFEQILFALEAMLWTIVFILSLLSVYYVLKHEGRSAQHVVGGKESHNEEGDELL